MDELTKRLASVQSKQYIELFGLTNQQAEYFADKDVLARTQAMIFRDVVRNAELNYVTPETGVITSTMRVRFGNIDICYGYVHSFGDPIVPQLYCISGHMLSQDGEYRKDLVPVRQYDATLKLFSVPTNMIIEHIRKLVHDGEIAIVIDHYPASARIELGMLPYFILALGWFNDKVAIDIGVIDKHIFGTREQLVVELPGGDLLHSRLKSLDGFAYFNMSAVTKYPDGRNAGLNCGQKIIPVTSLALASPHDVNFAIWREIYINEMVSQLVMNNICTGFAYTAGWFYISGADPRLYDGEASRVKYRNSETAYDIRNDVKQARSKTMMADERYPTDDPRHDIQSPINNQFAMLHSLLTGSMKFTDTHLILSSYALCLVSVHTNVTVSNVALLAKVCPNNNILSKDMFGSLLFDYLYDLYCLNHRVKAMHSDLHISNATIMRLNIFPGEYRNTAYVVGDDIYSLPYGGMIGCVIDFSRGIIGDTEGLSKQYNPQFAASVQTSQVQMLADLVRRHFPEIHSQYQTQLRIVAEDHFDAFFQVCTIIDAYSLSCGIGVMFDTQPEYRETKYAKVQPDLRQLVQLIIDTSREIFIHNMETLMKQHTAPAKLPMLELIETVFGDKRINWPPPAEYPVSHVVNSNNPLKYNSETLNPLVDPTIEIQIRSELGIERAEQSFATRNYVNSAKSTVDEIARAAMPDDYISGGSYAKNSDEYDPDGVFVGGGGSAYVSGEPAYRGGGSAHNNGGSTHSDTTEESLAAVLL